MGVPNGPMGAPNGFRGRPMGPQVVPWGNRQLFQKMPKRACWTLFKIECSGLFYIGSTGTCMCICVCIKGNGPCVHAW